jgi:hypothetical protein
MAVALCLATAQDSAAIHEQSSEWDAAMAAGLQLITSFQKLLGLFGDEVSAAVGKLGRSLTMSGLVPGGHELGALARKVSQDTEGKGQPARERPATPTTPPRGREDSGGRVANIWRFHVGFTCFAGQMCGRG